MKPERHVRLFASVAIAAFSCLLGWPTTTVSQDLPASFERATLIHINGDINRRQFQFFEAKVEVARRRGSDLVILVIDSPGGLLQESMQMATTLRDIDWAVTVAWIPDRAISGAALLSLGCDRIVMGNNARFGDAGVIELNENFLFQYVEAKFLSDVVRQVRDLAESKGRSPDLAEALVDRSAVVFQRTDPETGEREFKIKYAEKQANGELEIEPEAPEHGPNEPSWEVVPETLGNRFLEVNARRGQELGLAEKVVASQEALLADLNVTGKPLELKPTTLDTVVFILTRSWMTFVLILIGLIALYFELSAPGISIGGLISALCFVLFFWSRFLGGTAGALEIVLFLSGIVFLLMEIFVIPGFGISGIMGLILVVASIVMAGQSFIVPATTAQLNQLTVGLATVLGSFLCFGVAASLISRRMGTLPIFKRLILTPPETSDRAESLDGGDGQPAKPMTLVSVGQWGVAESVLRPAGKARFQSRSIDVVADGAYIEAGTSVQIVEISGNRIVVAADPFNAEDSD